MGEAAWCDGGNTSAAGLVLIPFIVLVYWFYVSIVGKLRWPARLCLPDIAKNGASDDRAEIEYDVFLSFRGPDTRNGFTDHLYESMRTAGIHVFRDEEEVRHGAAIWGEIERAISHSKIYVVVFSRNYASSTWCLQELTMMVHCCQDPAARKIILPIFYGVGASDVKLQTELYQCAIHDHRMSHGRKAACKWEEALLKVGQICGWESKSIRGEGKLVRLIIHDVLGKLKIRDRNLPQHLTDIVNRVEDVMKLPQCESPEQRRLQVLSSMECLPNSMDAVSFLMCESRQPAGKAS